MLISLAEYAERHGKCQESARKMAQREVPDSPEDRSQLGDRGRRTVAGQAVEVRQIYRMV